MRRLLFITEAVVRSSIYLKCELVRSAKMRYCVEMPARNNTKYVVDKVGVVVRSEDLECDRGLSMIY